MRSQAGSGAGPFADVVDVFWSGTVDVRTARGRHRLPARRAFARTGSSRDRRRSNLTVQVSLHAYADYLTGPDATFTRRVRRTLSCPACPCAAGPISENACAIGPARAATGRAHRVAEIDGVAFVVVLLPGASAEDRAQPPLAPARRARGEPARRHARAAHARAERYAARSNPPTAAAACAAAAACRARSSPRSR